LKETGGLQCFRLVALTCCTRAHVIAHQLPVVLEEEVGAEALQCPLKPFVPDSVCHLERSLDEGRRGGNQDLAITPDEAVLHAPVLVTLAPGNGLT
jgi:hypothetical protein